MTARWDEVRRSGDGELCGHVTERGGRWFALTVFGAPLGGHAGRDGAVDQVLGEGLASLSERWTLRDPSTGEDEVVCIVEVHPGRVKIARDYYALPGVPTLTITKEELEAGEWELRRS